MNSSNGYSHGRAKKRGNSILLRLTASQVWRSVVLSFKIDLIILLIAVAIIFFYLNFQASKAIRLMGQFESVAVQTEERIQEHTEIVRGDSIYSYIEQIAPDVATQIIVEDVPQLSGDAVTVLEQLMGFHFYTSNQLPYSFTMPDLVTDLLSLPRNTLIRLEFEWFSWSDIHFKYLVIIPGTSQWEYAFLSFNLLPMAAVCLAGFLVLAAFQLMMVLFGIFGIRRSTKKILRPINELTAVAQIINTGTAGAQPKPIKLDGTIDTLNAITEDHLDTRIHIDDEREELKGLATAINAMLDRLDAAYQAQLRFVSDASHELRTPIAVIQGYANLLDRWGKRDEKALQESIDAIKGEAEGMEGLVNQLLFLARSDNNTLKTEMGDINISQITEEIVKETAMIDAKHIIAGSVDDNLLVYGDGQLLKQVIRVFVDNAIKYTPEGGRIRISGHREGEKVYLAVSDTGIGISDKDLSQVFERFFRADESRARKTGGTGLGLAIAKNIVERHGGYMEIVSRVNVGTKIVAVLPAKIAATSPIQVEPSKQGEYRRPEAV